MVDVRLALEEVERVLGISLLHQLQTQIFVSTVDRADEVPELVAALVAIRDLRVACLGAVEVPGELELELGGLLAVLDARDGLAQIHKLGLDLLLGGGGALDGLEQREAGLEVGERLEQVVHRRLKLRRQTAPDELPKPPVLSLVSLICSAQSALVAGNRNRCRTDEALQCLLKRRPLLQVAVPLQGLVPVVDAVVDGRHVAVAVMAKYCDHETHH